ncbi:hypothetical protein JHK82_022541 [Glycine max]|nr:hypothetical protein JHK82_022541 [Glycine max]
MDHKDPCTHLSTFMELCSTMGASDKYVEAVYLRAFPFSLAGKAKTWLQSHPNKSLNTWEEVEKKFIGRLFPTSRFISAKSAIMIFSQGSDEPLCETWERFKALLRTCLNHNLDDAAQLHIYYSGGTLGKPKYKQPRRGGGVYTGELVRATASPDDESERSTIPPAWEAGASAVASLKQ